MFLDWCGWRGLPDNVWFASATAYTIVEVCEKMQIVPVFE